MGPDEPRLGEMSPKDNRGSEPPRARNARPGAWTRCGAGSVGDGPSDQLAGLREGIDRGLRGSLADDGALRRAALVAPFCAIAIEELDVAHGKAHAQQRELVFDPFLGRKAPPIGVKVAPPRVKTCPTR